MGAEVTDPVPVPARVTLRLNCGVGVDVKVAAHVAFAVTTIDALAAVPVQLPDQPANVEPRVATADSVTVVFCVKLDVHTLPQEMPAGADVTVPAPVPVRVTVTLNCVGGGAVPNNTDLTCQPSPPPLLALQASIFPPPTPP